MPIGEDKWNEKDEFAEYSNKIYKFLKENFPNAYSYDEIRSKVGMKKQSNIIGYDWTFWSHIIKRLKENFKIEISI